MDPTQKLDYVLGLIILLLGDSGTLQALADLGVLDPVVAEALGLVVPGAGQGGTARIVADLETADSSLPNIMAALRAVAPAVNKHTDEALAKLIVQYPDSPPSWYTAPTAADDVAFAVWRYESDELGETPIQAMAWLERFAATIGQFAAFVLKDDPFLVVEGSWKYPPD